MRALGLGKEAVLRFYSSYDAYCRAAVKFAAAFFLLSAIHTAFGYEEPLNSLLLVLIAAAFCAFLSSNALVVLGAVFLEGQFWGASLEAALVGAVVILIWLLLYFTFLPGKGYAAAATALLLGLKLPFAAPVVCALLMGPGAAAGIFMGAAAYYLAVNLGEKGQAAQELSVKMLEQLPERFQTLLLNQEMLIMLVVLLAVFAVVYLIRRIPFRYSWQIGIVSGAVVYGLLRGMKWRLLGEEGALPYVAADLLLGLLAGFTVQFFRHSLDYRKIQRLQFEDDDYYYYVKAVPKLRYGKSIRRPEEGLPDTEEWLDEELPEGEEIPDRKELPGTGERGRKGEERE